MRQPFVAILLLASAAVLPVAAPAAPKQSPAHAIADAVNAPGRTAADRVRDRYRHPAETLAFFGVAPGQTLVELYPSGGWYTRILLPLLWPGGRYVAAVGGGDKAAADANAMIGAVTGSHAEPVVVAFSPASQTLSEAGTADRVLTFRNIHNLLMRGEGDGDAPAFFAAAFKALKPGGVLGVVEHHLPESADTKLEKSSGYVKQSTVVRLATAAGFKFAGASPINANPKDTHDWPEGVWTLPPTFKLGDKDRAKYAAIGESDRMTLKFVKP